MKAAYLTTDQEYILRVLKELHFFRKEQVYQLLHNRDNEKRPDQAEAALRQLTYLRKVVVLPGEIISLPFIGKIEPDEELLECVDVMLGLHGRVLSNLAVNPPPYRLRFSIPQDKAVQIFGILFVPSGQERKVCELLGDEQPDNITTIFRLENLESSDAIRLAIPHYLAVRDGSRYRYYKGGEASQ